MQKLYKKTYELEIKIPKFIIFNKWIGEKVLKFEYKQATIDEILAMEYFLEKSEENIYTFIFNFLNKHGGISKRQFSYLTSKQKEQIFKNILTTYAKDRYKLDQNNKKKTKNTYPNYAFVANVLKECNLSLKDFLNCTWEQINYLAEGLVYNANEMTKKGKAKNKVKIAREESQKRISDDEARELIKKHKAKQDLKDLKNG